MKNRSNNEWALTRPTISSAFGVKPGMFLALTIMTASPIAASVASAQDDLRGPQGRAAERIERMFERLDTDGNGVISNQEITIQRSESFSTFDTDGNGRLTVTEIAAAQEAAREKIREARVLRDVSKARSFAKADTNNDGALSAEEFANHRGRMFDRVDANDDGDITREEAETAASKMRGWFMRNRGHGRG